MTLTPDNATVDLKSYLQRRRTEIDETLDRFLQPENVQPEIIHKAMRYSVLAGGKRVRPILAIAAAEACGADPAPLLRHFAALELIHTYSLIHDDLPAMDDDDLRRGRPTAHVVFGEAIAILAGDALLTEAFIWLAEPIPSVDPFRQLRAIRAVASAVDSRGMIGGQVEDIESERLHLGESDPKSLADRLRFIHLSKTARLLTASVLLGGLLANATEAQLAALEVYGRSAGLAFQIVDDLLDQEGTAESLGKTAGKDLARGKLTYPAVIGAEKAREEIATLLDRALASAGMIGGRVNYLGPIARYICERRN